MSTIDPAPTLVSRRVAWLIIASGVASLALTIAARLTGAALPWTAWALPLLLVANTAVLFLGALNRWPRLVRIFFVVSITLAGAVIVSETLALLHR